MRDAQKGRKSWLERLTSPPEADDESYPQDAVPGGGQQGQPVQGPAPGQPGQGMPPGGPQFGPPPAGPPGQVPQGMPHPPDGPPPGPPPGVTPDQDVFDPFAPPMGNSGEEERSEFAVAFDESSDGLGSHVSDEPREPWAPRDNPEFSDTPPPVQDTPPEEFAPQNTATPHDAQGTPQDAPGPWDTPGPRDADDEPRDRPPEVRTPDPAGPAPGDDADPFDVPDEEPEAPAPVAAATTVAPTVIDRQPDPEPTDAPPWEREPRTFDPAPFTNLEDAPVAEGTVEFSADRTDETDEATFMSTVDEPVQSGPSEEEQLEAARKRHVDELQQRWLITQAQLLDDPRDAVREAGLLIGDAMQFVTTTFTEHRDRIEQEWKDNADMNTDEMRAIMRRYRNLFQYVLSASQLPDL